MKPFYFSILMLLLLQPLSAGPSKAFSKTQLENHQALDRFVVIGFHSKSCGSCKIQKPKLEALLKTREFENIYAEMADFDQELNLRKSMKVNSPSTLVLFKGEKELGRLIGETDEHSIVELLRKAK